MPFEHFFIARELFEEESLFATLRETALFLGTSQPPSYKRLSRSLSASPSAAKRKGEAEGFLSVDVGGGEASCNEVNLHFSDRRRALDLGRDAVYLFSGLGATKKLREPPKREALGIE